MESELSQEEIEFQKRVEEGATNRELIEYTIDYVRKEAYQNFPHLDPKVVEALLILCREVIWEIFKDMGQTLEMPAKEVVDSEEFNKIGRIIGLAFGRTIQLLARGNNA